MSESKPSKSEKRKRQADSDVVDCEKASRNVWLVKVPRYLSEIWEANIGTNVGRLVQKDNNVVNLISTTPDAMASNPPSSTPVSSAVPSSSKRINSFEAKPVGNSKPIDDVAVPTTHSFNFRPLDKQTFGILLEDKSDLREDANERSGKLIFEGKVAKRVEIQPVNNEQYMRMKCNRICRAMQPVRMVQKVDRAVVTFKPMNKHAETVVKEKSKKDLGNRTARASRDVVMDMIFQAFEKHQYYKLIDLQAVTKQPQTFIREILTDIAVYNTVPPHKSMWELKPEYRNYKPSYAVEKETPKK